MAEIMLILWFSLVCVLIAGFILGYQLGKVVTIKHYHVSIEQQVKELINED